MIRFEDLTQHVGEWSHRNFGSKQNPFLGLVEELGELAHCLLKREQGIRGYDRPAFFEEEYRDALGDICIYAANLAYNERIHISWPRVIVDPDGTSNRYISEACYWLSLFNYIPEATEEPAHRLDGFLICVSSLARLEKLDLWEIAEKTWEIVSVRDWKANVQDGITNATS